MALTREILLANSALSNMTDEMVNAIVTLSTNDENAVIARKTGEIYGQLDTDILAVSGVAKNGTEKTYDYAKRVLGDFKTKADGATGLETQIKALKEEKEKLEKAISENTADKETVKALNQAKADLASITKQFNELNTEFATAKENHAKELFGVKIDGELQQATAGVKFKAGLPESVTKVILAQATEKIKAMNPEYIDDGNGGRVLAFKDTTGAILRNKENQLNPFTPAELITRELDAMGVLDKGRRQQGSGTRNQNQHTDTTTSVDVSGARTRVEAYEAISSSLMAQGLTAGSKAFEEAMQQAWKDNNVSQLPEQ